MTKSAPIGLVGIGLMGEVLAGRLIAAGFSVLGYDIDPAKGERLAKMGGKAGSLAEVAQILQTHMSGLTQESRLQMLLSLERAEVP